jgi:hypothetical protein
VNSVYVGPTEPYQMVPPLEAFQSKERLAEWSMVEGDDGSVLVTHRDPRAWSEATPLGLIHRTRIGSGNICGIQYEPEAIVAPTAAKKVA